MVIKHKKTEFKIEENQDIQSLITSLNEINQNFLQINKKYTTKQSELDRMQQDILHYIEFNDFSAVAAYRLSMELKKVREKRREIKTIVEVLDAIKLGFNTDKINAHVKNKIKQLNCKVYRVKEYKGTTLKQIANCRINKINEKECE